MKPFRFSLARILEHRRSEEEDALQQLGLATARLEATTAALRIAEEEYQSAQTCPGDSLADRIEMEQWLNRLEDARSAARILRGIAEGELEGARTLWLEARMRRRAIEVLEDHEREAWNEVAARYEQRENDDFVGARWTP
ncbi:MAG: flagellar export protein FliJ [Fimbriimonadaceae bacterium]|nr:flagellar export protein FliJ [Fimbriimonadaceae bacterium]